MPARRGFDGRRVLLGVTGGIAAYKAIKIARLLTQAGARVTTVLSAGATDFVGALSFESVTGQRAHTAAHASGDPLLHIRLAREADLVLIAPATANAIARAAAGMADDLLTTVLLATPAPVLVCPAMNDRMYFHPQTGANLRRLEEIGYRIAGPGTGPLAWGEGEGPGRLLEPEAVVAHAGRALASVSGMSGRRVLVTAGPTREPVDPVRYLGNRSSGRMGYALAAAAWRRGASVTLISGPCALPPPTGAEVRRVETAGEMAAAVREMLPTADVLLMAAAVADFRPSRPSGHKIKKEGGGLAEIALEPAPDILMETAPLRRDRCVAVGFALETGDAVARARAKLTRKSLDLLVVNDASDPEAGFEVPTNRVTLIAPGVPRESLPVLAKEEVAERILERVEGMLPESRGHAPA